MNLMIKCDGTERLAGLLCSEYDLSAVAQPRISQKSVLPNRHRRVW
jgi:hypothetical protein